MTYSWIPIESEIKPKDGQTVILTVKHLIPSLRVTIGYYSTNISEFVYGEPFDEELDNAADGFWTWGGRRFDEMEELRDVVAWMPYPEPYPYSDEEES